MSPDARNPRPSVADSETVTVAPRPAAPAEALTLPPMSTTDDHGSPIPVAVPDYEILAELGRGGMGVVYKARQIAADRVVALKMILSGGHAAAADLARFRREAQAVARLQHPGIVQVFEVGEHQGLPFFSLEFVDGGGLDRKLSGTPLPPGEAARLVEQVAEAMDAAHRQHIIHRDLKPANILLTSAGQPKVTDFGLAKTLDVEQGHTATGAIMGTPSYMAPEQAGGRSKEIGPAADTYALGAVLYECLTGRPPFKAATPLDTILQVISDEPVSPRQLQPKVPRDLETICLKCLHKEPSKRYGSAAELGGDLRRFREGEPIQARPVGAAERALKWVKRRPALASLLAVVVLSVLSLLGGGAWFTAQLQRERDEAERARDAEAREKEKARTAQQAAENALTRAQAAERKKDEQLRLAEMRGYALQISLARRELQVNDLPRVLHVLDECPQNLRHFEHGYLRALCRRRLLSLRGPNSVASCVAFHPDGRRLAVGSWDQTVTVWDSGRGTVLFTLPRHADRVSSVVYSHDGRLLATAAGNLMQPRKAGQLQVWDAATGKALCTLAGHRGGVSSLAFSPDDRKLASASYDGSVKVWDSARGQEVLSFRAQPDSVFGLAFSRDGKRLATANADQTVKLWDATTGAETLSLKGHRNFVTSVAFHPDGRRLASAAADGTVKVWDLAAGKALFTLPHHPGNPLWCAAFRPDGKRLVSGSDDHTTKEWDPDSGQELITLKGQAGLILGLAYSPDGRRLASAGGDRFQPAGSGVVEVWDRAGFQPARAFRAGWMAHSLAFSPDGKRLASGWLDQQVRVWDLAAGKLALSLPARGGIVHGVAFRPDGNELASVCGGFDAPGRPRLPAEVQLWGPLTGQQRRSLQGHQGAILAVAYDPEGRRLATASEDKTVKVWDAAAGRELLSLTGHKARVAGVAFHPGGRYLASASWDGTVRIWDLESGEEARQLAGPKDAFRCVAYSPDGRFLAGGCQDRTVRLWDAATGEHRHTLGGHTDPVLCLAFSADGRRLASGVGHPFHSGQPKEIKIWEPETGQEVLTLEAHTDQIHAVAFSPDGSRLASASADGTVKVWDAAPSTEVAGAPRSTGREARH